MVTRKKLRARPSISEFWQPLIGTLVVGLILVSAGQALAGGGGGDGGGTGTPEIDPTSTVGALTILTGGLLLIADRVRKRKSATRDS